MSAALKLEPRPHKWSVQDYLKAEKTSEVRHEYVGGDLYAMAGASEEHYLISLNIASTLRSYLCGKSCKVFNHDMRAKVFANVPLFYYPDVMVVSDPDDLNAFYRTEPVVVVEVLSELTRRMDACEKLAAFSQVPTLQEYVLVEQGSMTVTVHCRSREWIPDILTGVDALLELSSIGFSMPLSQIYEGVF